MPTERQNKRWLGAIRRGDFEAFEQLYHAYHRRIYGFFYRLCWDEERAEALLQDAFIRLWKSAMVFDRECCLPTQIYRLGRNTWLEHERLTARTQRRKAIAPKAGTRDDDAKKPISKKKQRAGKRKLAEASIKEGLAGLSTSQRLIIVLSFYQGLPLSQIAEVLDQSLEKTQSDACKAEQELRGVLSSLVA